MPAVREAAVDGLFYPAAPAALRAQIIDYLRGVAAAAAVDVAALATLGTLPQVTRSDRVHEREHSLEVPTR